MRQTRIVPPIFRSARIAPIVVTVLLAVLAVGLGACGPDETPDPEPTAAAPSTAEMADAQPTPGNRRPAVAVVERYYQALDGQQLRRAYDLWSDSATRGTFEEFTRRHQGASNVRVELGSPSDVRRAGDIRLLDVPATVTRTVDGESQTTSGTVTVRRSVAPGAERADRRWKIDRIELDPA